MKELVEIERMGYGAEAIAHASDGKTLFVQGGVPGDTAEVEITLSKKSYAKARVVRLESPSSDRVTKNVPDALESGATWAHLNYAAQLRAKRANLVDALKRTAKLDASFVDDVVKDIIACKDEWGYRNKVELSAFRDSQNRFCLGAHELSTSNNVALKKAPLGNRLIDGAPKALTGVLRYLQGDGDLGIFRVGVRASLRTKDVEVALWTPPSSFPRNFAAKAIKDAIGATSVVRILANPGSARKVKKVEVLDGSGFWREKMGWKSANAADSVQSTTQSSARPSAQSNVQSGPAQSSAQSNPAHPKAQSDLQRFDYCVSAPSFFQVNTSQAELLVGLVLDGLEVKPGMHVADLYSGVGTFSMPLARQKARVSAIEIAGSSTRDLVRNAQAAGFDIDVICDDTSIALPNLKSIDAMVVDPPRSGLEEKVISQIADASPARLAYVSCDPQTFARDIRRLVDSGYDLKSATPVDMFPQTYHVETVGILEKR